MGAVNVEMLLKPVADDKPCGDDLRYNARFLEVLRMAETGQVQEIGKPGEPGYKRVEPEEPNWREVSDGCVELLAQTRHLSICVTLCLCQIRREGYEGLADSLALMRGLLEQRWDTVYPLLDPDDNLDPLERSNILSSMSSQIGTFGDPYRFLERIREIVLCESPRVGPIRLKDIAAAMGEVVDAPVAPGEGGESQKSKLDLPIIDAAFAEVDPALLDARAKAIEACVEHVDAIAAAFKAGMKADYEKLKAMGRSVREAVGGPDHTRLRALLADGAKQVRKRIQVAAGAPGAEGAPPDGSSGGGGGGAMVPRLAGEVRNADDVLMAMEKVIQYYQQYEPSSPVGVIVQCAKKMVRRNFLEISRVLTPSEIQMLEKISTTE